MQQPRTRGKYWREVLLSPAFGAYGVVSLAYALLSYLQSQLRERPEPSGLEKFVDWIPSIPFTWWLIITLVVLVLISMENGYRTINTLEKDLYGLKSSRPILVSTPEQEGSDFFVKIMNSGGVGDISGKLTILDSSMSILLERENNREAGHRYDVYWEEFRHGTARIHKGHYDRIHLSGLRPNDAGSVDSIGILYWDSTNAANKFIDIVPYTMFPPPEPDREHFILVEVHLKSDPELLNEWRKVYKVTPEYVEEVDDYAVNC